MKSFSKCFLLVAMMVWGTSSLMAQQQSSLAYLEQVYPQLTELYREELMRYPAHYVFAVDVSGTMKQYSEDVVKALRPFIQALPDGDRVDVIPFGTEALPNMLSFCGVINSEVREALHKNIQTLYTDPSYSQEFKNHTDIPKVISTIAKVLQNNRDYKVNVVILLTDFRNDVKGENPAERKLRSDEIERLHDEIAAATNGIYTRCVALRLPVDESKPGYCLPQLKNQVFSEGGGGLEIVPLTNPGVMIGQWFEQLKRDIMVTKLKAIIDSENRMSPIRLETKTDIDGNVTADIHWKPSKLYPRMRIDSTYLSGDGFMFENNSENYTVTCDSVMHLDLGQIKHGDIGFHQLNDTLNLGILLPTPYDDELTNLGVKKPLPNTKKSESRWLFTFFLSFVATVIILLLILLYIIGVIHSMIRNRKLCFKGNFTFYDSEGNQIDEVVRLPKQSPSAVIHVGNGGTGRCRVDDAEWQFLIEKKKANPFLVFTKPCFAWRGTKRYVAQGKALSGKISYDGPSTIRVQCGRARSEITHSVKVVMVR